MKFFKYTLVAAASAMALGFSACSDDNEYQPATATPGLYFSTGAAATEGIDPDATSFTVTVSRSGMTEAATYALSSTAAIGSAELEAAENPFTVPASVAFADGAESADVVININPALFDANTAYTLILALPEDAPAYNFGSTTTVLTVQVKESWSDWEEYGDGLATWNYAQGFFSDLSGDDPDLPLSIRDNLNDPTKHQFRLEHWAANTTLIIDWDETTNICTIEPQLTGKKLNVTGIGVCDCYISTIYPLFDDTTEAAEASTFDPETGEFDLYVLYVVPYNGGWGRFDDGGYEYLTCGEYADYSIALTYNGYLTKPNEEMAASLTVSVGAQASKALLAISADLGATDLLGAILGGTVETVELGPGANQNVELPIATAGDYTVVAVSFKDDEAQQAAKAEFAVTAGTGGSWKNIATVDFVDGWVTPFYEITDKNENVIPYTELAWQVQGQASLENDGVYRLKSPWTNDDCVLYYLGANINKTATDLIIDAQNPNCVKVVPQYSGFSSSSEEFYIANMAGYYSTQGIEDNAIIGEGFNDIWDDGYIYISVPLVGWTIDKCTLIHRDEPHTEIFFDLQGSSAAPAKAKAKNTFNAARVNASVKSGLRIPMIKNDTRSLYHGPVTVTEKPFRVR